MSCLEMWFIMEVQQAVNYSSSSIILWDMAFPLTWMSFSWLECVCPCSFTLKMGTLYCSVLGCRWYNRKDQRKDNARKNPLLLHARTHQCSPRPLQASLPSLVTNFKVHFWKLSLDFHFTHEKLSLTYIYNSKIMKTMSLIMLFC